MSAETLDQPALRVLVLSRNYPNSGLPLLGMWSRRLIATTKGFAETKVVAPTPYAPPLIERVAPYFARYRDIEPRRWDDDVEVFHPRLLTGPGQRFYPLEALSYFQSVRSTVSRIRDEFPFDLIHAHFTYPDGLVAALLGQLYGTPVLITEHALWLPWMRAQRLVRYQSLWAARVSSSIIAVSQAVRNNIVELTGNPDKVRVIPNVVSGDEFAPPEDRPRNANQILFVGILRQAKGFDVLLHALRLLRADQPAVRLKVVGDPFYRAYREEAERLRQLAEQLGVADCIEYVGGKSPAETASLMAESQVVVLPSRRESFGTVLIEALACGTPVVATRCGGPEDIVTPQVGHLVPPEDPQALASALASTLASPQLYSPLALRQYALGHFGPSLVGQRLANLYSTVVGPAVRLNLEARLAAAL